MSPAESVAAQAVGLELMASHVLGAVASLRARAKTLEGPERRVTLDSADAMAKAVKAGRAALERRRLHVACGGAL